MNLGAFSISLAVADLARSRAFYEELGFAVVGGDAAEHWLILRQGDHTIGLFEGMLERNTLTFNPGWDDQGRPLPDFTDVREIQRRLRAAGMPLAVEADEASSGPAYLIAVDPDGNPVLIDQHVPRPGGA